jgi:uncharacterized protein (TIGR00106 family)
MHFFIINASIQILAIDTKLHPYEWADKAISIIQRSKLKYEVGPFATVVEGGYDEVMKVIHDVNEHLLSEGCSEWISNIQVQIRNDKDITAYEKVDKYR